MVPRRRIESTARPRHARRPATAIAAVALVAGAAAAVAAIATTGPHAAADPVVAPPRANRPTSAPPPDRNRARDRAPAGDGPVYVAAGSELGYAAVTAPLAARALGPIALAAADRVRQAHTGASPAPLPEVLGEIPAGAPPPGWPREAIATASRAAPRRGERAVAGARDDRAAATRVVTGTATAPLDAETLADPDASRIAVLYVTRTFEVGDEIADLRLLALRVRYRDGLVAHINGREVARRNLPRRDAPNAGQPGSPGRALALAQRPHGPEWETFHVALVPGMLRRGTNTLALEVRPSGYRLAPWVDVELSARRTSRIVRGPIVQRVGARDAVIAFETDLPVRGAVEYEAASRDAADAPSRAALGEVRASAGGGLAVRHTVALTGLPAGAPIHYRVVAGDERSPTYTFHTAPAAGEVVRFVVYGDMRGGHDTHAEIVAAAQREAPDFVVLTGDLVLRGTDEGDWQRFFGVAAPLLARVPYYPVVGNHDMGRSGDQARRLNEIFALWPGPTDRPAWGHWYSFDVGDVHFAMLDSNGYEHAGQLAWLRADLADARRRGVRAIFAAVHDGPYSRGYHGGNQLAAERYAPVLAEHGVALLFAGHDHLYQRGERDGLRYMVSGGGGAPLYSVRCGVGKRRRCRVPDGMQHVASEHHYIAVTVFPRSVRACPRRTDGSALEPCVDYRLAAP